MPTSVEIITQIAESLTGRRRLMWEIFKTQASSAPLEAQELEDFVEELVSRIQSLDQTLATEVLDELLSPELRPYGLANALKRSLSPLIAGAQSQAAQPLPQTPPPESAWGAGHTATPPSGAAHSWGKMMQPWPGYPSGAAHSWGKMMQSWPYPPSGWPAPQWPGYPSGAAHSWGKMMQPWPGYPSGAAHSWGKMMQPWPSGAVAYPPPQWPPYWPAPQWPQSPPNWPAPPQWPPYPGSWPTPSEPAVNWPSGAVRTAHHPAAGDY